MCSPIRCPSAGREVALEEDVRGMFPDLQPRADRGRLEELDEAHIGAVVDALDKRRCWSRRWRNWWGVMTDSRGRSGQVCRQLTKGSG